MKQAIEKSIIKSYRKEIWTPFVRAIKTFNLIDEGDKIAVCLSGGKDSFLLAKCMQELNKYSIYKFELVFLVMDPGFDEKTLASIKKLAKDLDVSFKLFHNDIFAMVKNEKKACYLCAKKRRGYLYAYAQEMGCNKIALGHHFDDVVETIFMNIFYNGRHQTMMPKVRSQNFENITLIRPLYFVAEKNIIRWQKHFNLAFLNCACDTIVKKPSKREAAKKIIKSLEKENPDVKINLYNASKNVNLDALIGYKKENIYHYFDY